VERTLEVQRSKGPGPEAVGEDSFDATTLNTLFPFAYCLERHGCSIYYARKKNANNTDHGTMIQWP